MATWIPMFALPNVDVQEAIDADGMTLASSRDERVRALAKKHRRFAMYMRRFKTEFGQAVEPSIVLYNNESSQNYRSVEAVAGFRDAIAMSVIPYSWAHCLRYENNFNIRYANQFSFFPWMVDNKYEGLIMQSMAQLGYHEVKALKGQTTAGFPFQPLTPRMIDKPLLIILLKRWKERFSSPTPDWNDIALFRSLNMAFSAAMLPGNVEVTIYDIGKAIALWVSAFEILAHPGASQVGYVQVYKMLESATWNLTLCSKKIYEPYGYKRGQQKRSLPVWLYGELNRARNDFLHGNPITTSRLIVAPGKQALHLYTAPLFRMALTAFLDLKMDRRPARASETEYEAFRDYEHEFGRFQRDIEAALSTILYTKEENRAYRTGHKSRPLQKSS